MKIIDIWVNCPTEDCANQITSHLISERLAACTNLYSAVSSQFRWKGRVEQETEYPLLIKTRASLADKVESAVRDHHPYETPSIVGVLVDHVNDDYANWVYQETID